jgi:peptidoglycan hydrolase CwlO-like protein
MQQEDLKNLMGWLQAIHKEAQGSHSSVREMKMKVDLLPEIERCSREGLKDSSEGERKIEELKNSLEGRIRHIEDILNELRSSVKEIQSKVNHLK